MISVPTMQDDAPTLSNTCCGSLEMYTHSPGHSYANMDVGIVLRTLEALLEIAVQLFGAYLQNVLFCVWHNSVEVH